jgi:hypothetical protein
VTFVYNVVLFLHFIGMALLIGGFFAQMGATPRTVSHWMRDGALTQLVTGLALAGMASSGVGTDESFSPAAVGTKLAIAAIVTIIVLAGAREPEDKQQPFWAAAGALALVNVAVAVFWLTA